MNISEMSMDQLKAMAYDNFVTMEQCQANIRALNAEIVKRSQKPEVVEVKRDSVN